MKWLITYLVKLWYALFYPLPAVKPVEITEPVEITAQMPMDFFEVVPDADINPVTGRTKRKTYDMTQFTAEQHDFIMVMYNRHIASNRCVPAIQRETQDILTARLNNQLELSKSKTAYSRIWLGYITRDSLKAGE